MKDIHIGSIIKKVFDEKSMTIAEFSRRINRERTTVYDIFQRKSIDTDLLLKISEVLDYEFLREVFLQERASASSGAATEKNETAKFDLPEALAFALRDNFRFSRAYQLSAPARSLYIWLQKYLTEAQTNKFTALDIRKAKQIQQRTLNRYLHELCEFRFIKIVGGNKYRKGYQYKIIRIKDSNALNNSV